MHLCLKLSHMRKYQREYYVQIPFCLNLAVLSRDLSESFRNILQACQINPDQTDGKQHLFFDLDRQLRNDDQIHLHSRVPGLECLSLSKSICVQWLRLNSSTQLKVYLELY